jgi:hypothetical protein
MWDLALVVLGLSATEAAKIALSSCGVIDRA